MRTFPRTVLLACRGPPDSLTSPVALSASSHVAVSPLAPPVLRSVRTRIDTSWHGPIGPAVVGREVVGAGVGSFVGLDVIGAGVGAGLGAFEGADDGCLVGLCRVRSVSRIQLT